MPETNRRYVEFRDIPVGATFGEHWQWVKVSTRTARHASAGRIFYFRQKDICRL